MNEPWVIKQLIGGGGGGGKPGVPFDTDSTNKHFALGIDANGKVYMNPDSTERAYVRDGETVAWGNITGTLSNQTDLQAALNKKVNKDDDTDTLTLGKDADGLFYVEE